MRISAAWLELPAVQQVCKLLESAGFEALLVGGCVRNTLLEHPVSDHDLSTNARPEQVIAVMRDAGLKIIPTGIDHGTVTVLADDEPFEITTYRHDIATDGRRAVVHFSDSVEEDARRRDFTMNAIYCDRHGEVVDPLDGMADLQARRLRFVGTAENRVREDYLRILRFFRFSAWYADPETGFDAAALDACARNADGLERISAERKGSEMRKLLGAPDPSTAISIMQTTGVLPVILPDAQVEALPIVVHLEQQVGHDPDPVLRLASLGGADVAKRLRLSRADARRLSRIGEAARSDQGPLELGYRLGADDGTAAVILRAGLIGVFVPPQQLEDIATGAEATFPVSAHDLIPALQGSEISNTLKALERRWIDSGFRLTRHELLS